MGVYFPIKFLSEYPRYISPSSLYLLEHLHSFCPFLKVRLNYKWIKFGIIFVQERGIYLFSLHICGHSISEEVFFMTMLSMMNIFDRFGRIVTAIVWVHVCHISYSLGLSRCFCASTMLFFLISPVCNFEQVLGCHGFMILS